MADTAIVAAILVAGHPDSYQDVRERAVIDARHLLNLAERADAWDAAGARRERALVHHKKNYDNGRTDWHDWLTPAEKGASDDIPF